MSYQANAIHPIADQPQGQPVGAYPPQGQFFPSQGQSYPPQGQAPASYPPQEQQSYTPQGQSYPPQGQSYPPQGQAPASYPPQGQSYPPQGQSYHPQGQAPASYPPQGQSYSPQGQAPASYPPQGQSYPPQGQSYPPQGQSYPPQGQSYPPQGQDPSSNPPPGPPADEDSHGEEDSDGEGSLQEGVENAPKEVENFVPTDLSGLKVHDGYGEVGFQKGEFLPPPPPPAYEPESSPTMEFGTAANISAEEAREALLEFVAQNCCYGKGAAEKMTFTNLQPSNALHYILETFCEGRLTARTEVPYFGGPVDGPFNGSPPMPWDIPCSPAQQFVNLSYDIPVPHTEEVRTCGMCTGCGFVRCMRCGGRGRHRCGSCGGRGSRRTRRKGEWVTVNCGGCHGSGKRRCGRCSGSGRVVCPHCTGAGQVKNFIMLTVTYTNHVTDYILEETEMPDHLIRGVSGVELYSQMQTQVSPIISFPVQPVNDNSQRLVEQSKQAYPTERQLNQRQILRAVPVTTIPYIFKDISSVFWVYGMERRVHSPDYPQQCCWGCTIL